MKLCPLVKVISLALVISQAANAIHNGKPFKAINTLIQGNVDTNGVLFEQNSDSMLSLSRELTALEDGGSSRDTGVTIDDMPLAFAKIEGEQVQLTTLEREVAQNKKAIDDVDLAIIVTNGKIDGLTQALAILNDTIVISTAAITEIEGKIVAADRKQTNIGELNASLNSYEVLVDQNFKQITENEAEIAISQNYLDTLTTKYFELAKLVDKNADVTVALLLN